MLKATSNVISSKKKESLKR